MILTTYIEPQKHVLQKVIGQIEFEELQQAIAEASSYPDSPVLWDLREVPFNGSADSVKAQVPRIISFLNAQMSSEKRAFVVQTTAQLDFLHDLFGSATVPWPWALFTSYKDAVLWITS
jgi:hypothetical protein